MLVDGPLRDSARSDDECNVAQIAGIPQGIACDPDEVGTISNPDRAGLTLESERGGCIHGGRCDRFFRRQACAHVFDEFACINELIRSRGNEE